MVEYIYYTGVGAKKNGKHNTKEFLKIMNKHFNIECSKFLPDLEYNSSKKTEKKYKKLLNKYKNTAKKRKCNLDEYIKFSGAEKKIRHLKC